MIRRKLFVGVIFLLTGIIAFFALKAALWAGLFMVLAALLMVKFSKKPCIYGLIFIVGIVLALSSYTHFEKNQELACCGNREEYICLVSSTERGPGRKIYLTSIIIPPVQEKECVNKQRLFIKRIGAIKLRITYSGIRLDDVNLIGKIISFSGSLDIPKGKTNPRGFDGKLFLRSKGVGLVATCKHIEVIEESGFVDLKLKRRIISLRETFLDSLTLSDMGRALVAGILFGETGDIDDDVVKIFRQNGTGHILAVSGLHIGMLYGAFIFIRKRYYLPFLTPCFMAILLMYGTATLWSPSVIRAISLVFIKLIAEKTDRRFDLSTALALSAGLMAVSNPYMIFSPGFTMSFLAAYSLSFIYPHVRRILPPGPAAAIAIFTGVTPYNIYTFNNFPIPAFLINPPTIFLASILVPLGISGLVIFALSGIGMESLGFLIDGLARFILDLNVLANDKIYKLIGSPKGGFPVKSPHLFILIAVYLVIFIGCSEFFSVHVIIRKTKKKVFSLLIIAGLITAGAFAADMTKFDQASVIFLDVGQGDAAFFDLGGKDRFFIDGGGRPDYSVGENILRPFLLKNRKGRLQYSFVTHEHMDHYKGLKEIEELGLCGPINAHSKAGDIYYKTNDVYIEVLWPLEEKMKIDDENYNSVVYMVHYKGLKILITGDIEEKGEEALVEFYKNSDKLSAHILKVSHHGSRTGSSELFLNAVNPRYAVISVGKNSYGHPSSEVIEKLEEHDIIVYRTDLDGAVGLLKEGDKFSICTMKKKMPIKTFIKT